MGVTYFTRKNKYFSAHQNRMTSLGAWVVIGFIALAQVDAQCEQKTYNSISLNGAQIEGKCYYAIERNEGFQYGQAEAACKSINGELAPYMANRDMISAVHHQFGDPQKRRYKIFWLKPMYDFYVGSTSDGEPVSMNLFAYGHPGCNGGRSQLNMALLSWESRQGLLTSTPQSKYHALCVV